MITQYPYQLQVLTQGESVQDANGDWVTPATVWIDYCKCRDEAGNGKYVKGVDGNDYLFSFLIQMPKGIEPISSGTQIRIMNGSDVRQSGKVLFSRKDQLHTRSWI